MDYTKTVGWKQNNLGNLRGYGVKWQGKTGMANGFSVFKDKAHGVRAIFVDLYAKIRAGVNTLAEIMEKYAPRSENNTDKYISFVEKYTGIPRNSPITLENLDSVVKAIIRYEIGYEIGISELKTAKNMFLSSINSASSAIKKKNNYEVLMFVVIIFAIIAYS